MKLSTITLLALPTLSLAWDLRTDSASFSGRNSSPCRTIKHQRGGYFVWKDDNSRGDGRGGPDRDGRRGCCIFLYDDRTCGGRADKHCRDFAGNADFNFDSFRVEC
ncbi:hypothetical protein EJ06DRAFT_526856 [Trichodelitschia bisporula]|uniref:Uncharacterized protein n=1 Tax=Trichodelitschia bisporula TaxID=703511 RepID=A0A6G1I946_9PEZI|nr:hypothetical protein EJ06DRAFT_526856 [Trichodelitschia bisporula]